MRSGVEENVSPRQAPRNNPGILKCLVLGCIGEFFDVQYLVFHQFFALLPIRTIPKPRKCWKNSKKQFVPQIFFLNFPEICKKKSRKSWKISDFQENFRKKSAFLLKKLEFSVFFWKSSGISEKIPEKSSCFGLKFLKKRSLWPKIPKKAVAAA